MDDVGGACERDTDEIVGVARVLEGSGEGCPEC